MKQVTSLFLILLILLSTSGITFAQHFCGDYVMMEKITFSEEQLSCGMAMVADACGDEEDESHSCCDNQFTKITTDDNFAQASYDVVLNDYFTASFVAVFLLEKATITKGERPSYSEYNPPPILKDIPVLYETFLI